MTLLIAWMLVYAHGLHGSLYVVALAIWLVRLRMKWASWDMIARPS